MANPQLEEILSMMAEFENRISFLENSLPGSAMSYQPEETSESRKVVQPQEVWEKRQWYIINQLRGEIANLKNKFANLEKKHTQKDRL